MATVVAGSGADRVRVLVVGAGIGGLACATWLARRGHSVTVLEATDRVGGRALSVRRPDTGDVLDAGTQYFHHDYRRARALLRDTDMHTQLHRIRGSTRFFDPQVARGSFLLDHRLPWIAGAGVSGNLRLGWHLLSTLARHRGDPYVPRPGARGDALDAVQACGPLALRYVLRPLTAVGGLAHPEQARPSVLHMARLIRIVLLTDYYCLRQGNAALHERLGADLDVRLERRAEALVVEGGRVAGIVLAGSADVLRADHVVVATAASAAASLLPAHWGPERDFLAGVRMPPFSLVNLYLDRPLEHGVWSYMLPLDGTQGVTMCVDAAQKNPSGCPSGKATLQLWPCFPASAELAGLPDAAVVERCLAEVEPWFPRLRGWLEGYTVVRHAGGVPWFPVGHQAAAAAFRARVRGHAGVSFCGDYLSGGYVESALWAAEVAVGEVEAAPR